MIGPLTGTELVVDGQAMTYPLQQIKTSGSVRDKLAGVELPLRFDAGTDSLIVADAKGSSLEQMAVYWFVWKAIWPETKRY